MEGPRLRPGTALWVWVAGFLLAVLLGALGQRLDSSYLRYEAGVLSLLVLWEAFIKSFVLGWVLLPVVAIQLRGRKANKEEDFKRRQMLMKLTAEAFAGQGRQPHRGAPADHRQARRVERQLLRLGRLSLGGGPNHNAGVVHHARPKDRDLAYRNFG